MFVLCFIFSSFESKCIFIMIDKTNVLFECKELFCLKTKANECITFCE